MVIFPHFIGHSVYMDVLGKVQRIAFYYVLCGNCIKKIILLHFFIFSSEVLNLCNVGRQLMHFFKLIFW
jgi:hypothetical protein